MTLKNIVQEKTILKDKILANLIILKTLGLSNQMQICRILGYEKDVLSRVKSDENYFGSTQLLAALELLKELTILKRTGVNQQLAGELETMKQRIEDLQRQISPKYPEHRPQNAALNEPKVNSAQKAADDRAVAAAVRKDARTSKPAPHRKS